GRAMMAAWSRVKRAETRLWSDWMTIGEGLLEGRRWAMQVADTNRPEGKGYVTAFAEYLSRFKVDDMDKSDRAKLLQLMEDRPAAEQWRMTLPDRERRRLNNPIIVWRKWTAETRVKRKPKRSKNASASASEVEQLQARVDELEEELEAKTGPPAPPTVEESIAAMIANAGALAGALTHDGKREGVVRVAQASGVTNGDFR